MKKLLGGLALAVLGVGAFLVVRDRADAMPLQILPAVKVECDGNNSCCMGSGPRNFFYRVKVPSGGAVQVTRVDIGTEDSNLARYSSFVKPMNWAHTIISASPLDRDECIPHGTTTSSNGTCQFIIRFSGPAQTSNFNLGFDYAFDDAHVVHWNCNTPNSASWTKPVGLGQGPVHGPPSQ